MFILIDILCLYSENIIITEKKMIDPSPAKPKSLSSKLMMCRGLQKEMYQLPHECLYRSSDPVYLPRPREVSLRTICF